MVKNIVIFSVIMVLSVLARFYVQNRDSNYINKVVENPLIKIHKNYHEEVLGDQRDVASIEVPIDISNSDATLEPQQVQQQLDAVVKGFYLETLKVDEEVYQKYLVVRNRFRSATALLFESQAEYQDSAAGAGDQQGQEQGGSPVYDPTQEEQEVYETVLNHYLEMLRDEVGEEVFIQYIQYINQYNEQVLQANDQGYPHYTIDF